MIAWGVGSGGVTLSSTDHEAMESAFAGEDWLRVFPGAVVVTLADDAHRLVLQEKLVVVSKEQLNSRAYFVMSPLMGSGTGIYRGFLPSTLWEPLVKKTA